MRLDVMCAKRWAGVLLGGWLGAAAAQCTRTIQVPMAPTGYSVIVEGSRVTGIFPEFLRQLGTAQRCVFAFPVYPRARLTQMFFETGEADVLIPATRNVERDKRALFVPLLYFSPKIMMLKDRAGTSSVSALLQRKALRAAVVRGYSWGNEYEQLLRQLELEKRVSYVNDLATVLRMLRAGRVEFSITLPSLMYAALREDGQPRGEPDEFRYDSIEGLPLVESGAYLSRQSLAAADLQLLKDALARGAHDGSLRRHFQAYYPDELLPRELPRP